MGKNRESTWERLVFDVLVKNAECGGGMGQAGDAGARAQVDAWAGNDKGTNREATWNQLKNVCAARNGERGGGMVGTGQAVTQMLVLR